MENQHYWELTLRDGQKIQIPPQYVEGVQRRWEAGEVIKTSRQMVAANQIVSFEKTAKRKIDVKLIEDASMAFHEPLEGETETGEPTIKARWVKMAVTAKQWGNYYSPNGYKQVAKDGDMVIVAFRQPVHQINLQVVDYCSDEDIKNMGK